MALDASTLALVAQELKQALTDARIDKIHQPTRDEVLVSLRSRTGGFRLLLSARTGSARVCLTQESYENPALPPSFCMLLRKHLLGGRLLDVRAQQGDRIVYFDFLCTNEMGDLVYNTVAAELMGRYCNLVLVRDLSPLAQAEGPPKIVDALKRVDFEDSDVRQLLPGLAYTLPAQPEGCDFQKTPAAEILAKATLLDMPVADALRKTLGNVGPVIAREVAHRGLQGENASAAQLRPEQAQRLQQALRDMQGDWQAGGVPTLVRKADGMPAEFSFTALTQYQPNCTLENYGSFSFLLEEYYAARDRVERLHQKSKELRKAVSNMYERAVRKQAAREEELATSEKSEWLRVQGELLTANLHGFQKGDSLVRLQNWYDQGQEVDIRLDPRLGPSQNAQKYFKEYKKKQTAALMLAKLLEEGRNEIVYLETVLYEIEKAQGEPALNEIRAELKSQGYLRYYKPKDKSSKPADFIRYLSADGFPILVGRNNVQNDKLTLKTARGKDLWFHTKNAPGSHVVVLSYGEDIPLETQNEAAMLAVWHSSQQRGAKVAVDYTMVKNIRKTGDLPPGMVLYEHYETAYVTADPEKIQEIQQRQPKEKS